MPEQQGPASGLFSLSKRILSQLVHMAESRLRLAAIELEEEKVLLTKLLLLAGISLICFAFALMSLLILICWAIDPAYRLTALSVMTVTLFVVAIAGIVITIKKSRQRTLLAETKRQLKHDLQLLEGIADNAQN